jgi:replicative DNA helicase
MNTTVEAPAGDLWEGEPVAANRRPANPHPAARSNVEAERAVLGAMMISRDAIVDAETHLTAEAFYHPANGTVFSAIVTLASLDRPTDPIAVAEYLTATGDLGRIGGAPYLHDLLASAPIAAQAAYHAGIVAGLYRLRQLSMAVGRANQLVGAAGYEDADQVAEKIIDLVVGDTGSSTDGPKPWAELIPTFVRHLEDNGKPPEETSRALIPTGWVDLDRLLDGGFTDGQLVVIAGRPGSGKSIAGVNIAQRAAFGRGMPVGVISLEMSASEIGMRMCSSDVRIPLTKLKAGQLDDADWSRVMSWTADTADAPLRIDEGPNLTVADIRARARRMKQRHGIEMLLVDYLQLVTPGRAESRQNAVADMSRGFKLLAKELGIPVLLIAQLNRGPEQRTDKRPQLSDLRESGSIEQDADVVIFVHRDDYYDSESPRAGEADLIVAKHRNGPTDTITVAAQLHLARFVDMAVI